MERLSLVAPPMVGRRPTLTLWRRGIKHVPRTIFTAVAATSLLAASSILLFVVREGLPAIQRGGMGFFLGQVWNPGKNVFAIFPMIVGSALVASGTLLLAVPIGVGAALYVVELAPERVGHLLQTLIELLAGIPSIVFGLIGVALLAPWLADLFHLVTGKSILASILVVSAMILPTIVSVSAEALRAVPDELRWAGRVLGATASETIRHVILPLAWPGIVAAVVLGAGRALGEAVAVALIIGSSDRLPRPFFNVFATGQTLTSKLVRETGEVLSPFQMQALFAIGLTLLLMVLAVSLCGTFLQARYRGGIR